MLFFVIRAFAILFFISVFPFLLHLWGIFAKILKYFESAKKIIIFLKYYVYRDDLGADYISLDFSNFISTDALRTFTDKGQKVGGVRR